MNIFTFTGRLGRDCDQKALPNGTAICEFAVAVTSGYGDRKESHWINCVLFGKRAESRLVEYLVKGQQVLISGELKTREYQKKDGTNGFSVEVNVDDLDLIGDRKKQDSQQAYQPPASQNYQPPTFDENINDEIPF